MSITERDKKRRRAIFRWYARAKRDLPWRHTRDPYAILVSEIMLQQTQVDRVVPKFAAFLRTFPTVRALAEASPATAIRAWSGLGYNRRALHLREAARRIVDRGWPRTVEGMRQFPGVGEYTAGALLSFAFGKRTIAFDVNVQRVLRRLFVGVGPERQLSTAEYLHRLAERLLPRDSSTWQQALMDLGAVHCRAVPRCATCPLAALCPSARTFLAGWREPRPSRASVPFRDSTRFVRGRIVSALREGRRSGAWLARALGGAGVSGTRTRVALAGLLRDGLVRTCRGVYSLPDA